jgi:hypothetical protein
MSPTATAAIVATQSDRLSMAPCPRHTDPTRLRTHCLTNCWLVPLPCTGALRPRDDCEIKPARAPAFPPYPRYGSNRNHQASGERRTAGVQGYSLRVPSHIITDHTSSALSGQPGRVRTTRMRQKPDLPALTLERGGSTLSRPSRADVASVPARRSARPPASRLASVTAPLDH